MGLMFYPRGGSAQVARYLSRAVERSGWDVSLASGSLGRMGQPTHAATFFAGLDVVAADYTPALERFERGEDHLAGPMPFHGSFEDRGADSPDPVFATLGPEQTDAQVKAWEYVLARAGFGDVDVIHLHHLTPMHEAVAHRWPRSRLITHLHGTELKMLDRIERLGDIAAALGTNLGGLAGALGSDGPDPSASLSEAQHDLLRRTDVGRYRHGTSWQVRLRLAARLSRQIVCISAHDRSEAVRLLGIPEDRITIIPNGVDTELFDRTTLTEGARLGLLRRWLVDEPQGWDASGVPGSIRYAPDALAAFADRDGGPPPTLLYVGRYLGFKRVPLLVRAYARARSRFETPAPLLVWGGFPGEWEGDHPHTVAEQLGANGIFFSGWRGHDELPLGLSCADVLVGPSVDEPFGQVFLEAMSCGLPVITTSTGGPVSFVNTVPGRPNGWLVEPDDVDALAEALVQAVNDAAGRRERAANATEQIRNAYSWHALAPRFATLYAGALDEGA